MVDGAVHASLVVHRARDRLQTSEVWRKTVHPINGFEDDLPAEGDRHKTASWSWITVWSDDRLHHHISSATILILEPIFSPEQDKFVDEVDEAPASQA